ncbi:MAG: peptidylprolyl isomerase [Nitratiruptor sp.]|nr:peptidylprolyl isomerase [Nitratiruptor sp.]NPA84221.1 peptidylprolyl isomerase [Campylobacterota bacterium]
MKGYILAGALIALGLSGAIAGEVIAEVNGKKITSDDVAPMLAQSGMRFEQLPPQIKEKVVEQAIERELLKEHAIKSGIQRSKEFQEALKRLKEDLALETWMRKQYDSITITDSEAKAFYEKNRERFKQPEMVHARHILVKSESEAKAIIRELEATPKHKRKEKFIQLAKERSVGPSGQRGGDLGFFKREQMVKPFSDAAFALTPGEFTKEPVKTQFGYHVIYVEEKRPASVVPFEKVKEQIKRQLHMERFQERVKQEVERLKKRARIKKML